MTSALKDRITDDMKTAMKSHDKKRLAVIRLILSAIKQVEVDTRETLSDEDINAILSKMSKQRQESIDQYQTANRQDLVDQEEYEKQLIAEYLPPPMSAEDLSSLVQEKVTALGATTMKDMGKVMAELKPLVAGRADPKQVSDLVKQLLN